MDAVMVTPDIPEAVKLHTNAHNHFQFNTGALWTWWLHILQFPNKTLLPPWLCEWILNLIWPLMHTHLYRVSWLHVYYSQVLHTKCCVKYEVADVIQSFNRHEYGGVCKHCSRLPLLGAGVWTIVLKITWIQVCRSSRVSFQLNIVQSCTGVSYFAGSIHHNPSLLYL